ncbi:helix-turn-helix domain-containing protein [Pedobacter sp. MW01-1-1]|uniref:helix-turn-helix domain-containing protein n=1 Tax=Pedobacter sp. MW01-1-1 TaxID=3383027 RepID=UPI003FEEDF13
MGIEILTKEDLMIFGNELLEEIKRIVKIEEPVKKRYLKGKEVRQILAISQGTLQNLRINGTLPYSKIGNVYYYDVKIVDSLLNGQTEYFENGKEFNK